jgi:hypothetical protein
MLADPRTPLLDNVTGKTGGRLVESDFHGYAVRNGASILVEWKIEMSTTVRKGSNVLQGNNARALETNYKSAEAHR